MSGPPIQNPPLIGTGTTFPSGSQLPNAPTIGEARTQLGDAWHDLMYAINKKQARQVNRVRVYGSQLMGAVR